MVGLQAASFDVVPPLPCLFVVAAASAASAAEIVAEFPASPLMGLEGKCPIVVVVLVDRADGLACL